MNLVAGVVNVMFRRDLITRLAHNARQGIAVSGAAAVSDMEISGRVGAHEFQVYLHAATDIACAEVFLFI